MNVFTPQLIQYAHNASKCLSKTKIDITTHFTNE